MVCIYCGSSTAVKNSRLQRRANQVWRRRVCQNCESTFTTHERVDLASAIAVKQNDGQVAPFSQNTLLISIYESCKHRTDSLADAEGLTQTALAKLRTAPSKGVLERNTIVTTVLATLARFDRAAATMYAAYHPIPAKSKE